MNLPDVDSSRWLVTWHMLYALSDEPCDHGFYVGVLERWIARRFGL